MSVAVLGTAHLFGSAAGDVSGDLLDAAWDAGFRAFDTAPLYGHGRSETELGERVDHWPHRPLLTSKVGLEPGPPPSAGVRVVKGLARRLPGALQHRLRPDGGPRGDFDVDLVRRSLDRTLRRLGRVDRLMLHEAHTEDLTDEVFAVLAAARDRGDVGQVGVATANTAAGAVARRAPDLVTAAHLEVGPFAPAADLPATVVTVVGHGVLGAGGSGLRRLSTYLHGNSAAAEQWAATTGGTRWAGPAGLADALVARAAALPLSAVIVATSRPDRLGNLRALASGSAVVPHDVAAALADLVDAVRVSAQGSDTRGRDAR